MILTTSDRYRVKLAELIESEIVDRQVALTSGTSKPLEELRLLQGQVLAYRRVLELLDDAARYVREEQAGF